MDEGSRVTRRILFNLADKATRYFNHWVFLNICLEYGVVPNGLKLRKSAQIGTPSTVFIRKWSHIIASAEFDILRALNEEYKTSCVNIQVELWDKIIQFLSDADNSMDVSEILSTLRQHIATIDDSIRRRRHKKLTNLLGTRNFLMLDKELVQQFELPSDLRSVFNTLVTVENQNLENVLETAENESNAELDLRNIQRILLEEEVNNVNIISRNETRTSGETSNDQLASVSDMNTEENQPAAVPDWQNIRQILMESEENNNANIIPRNNQETRTFGETSNVESTQQEGHNTNFQCKVDTNGRIEGQFLNDKVINLSKRALSESEISVLSKGLKFVMTPKELDYSQIKVDLESFGRRLRLK